MRHWTRQISLKKLREPHCGIERHQLRHGLLTPAVAGGDDAVGDSKDLL